MKPQDFGQSTFHSQSSLDQLLYFDEGMGVVYVSSEHRYNPHVSGQVTRLQSKNNGSLDVRYVSMEEIEDVRSIGHSAESSSRDGKNTEMEREALALFAQAAEAGASDVHIRVSEAGTDVLFRVHGDLIRVVEHPTIWGKQLSYTIYHAMADVGSSTFEEHNRQDAQISASRKMPKGVAGIRVATSPQVSGHLMVLRLLYVMQNTEATPLDLGFSLLHERRIEYIKSRPSGITLVTGPTGSGKSTTLQLVLSNMIKEYEGRKHMITVEDPPEYPIPGAIQTPVTNAETTEKRSLEFQKAIRGAMRLDPDVMMIGEVRDLPSARLAIEAAMTGHPVWATLHAVSAFHTFDRLVDLGIPLSQLADTSIITGLVSQRLLKTLCECKRPFTTMFGALKEDVPGFDMHLERFKRATDGRIDSLYVKGRGCQKCGGTGIVGRTVVAEVVATDEPMMSFIRAGRMRDAIEYWKQQHGGATLVEHASIKVRSGLVDPFMAEEIVGPLDAGRCLPIDSADGKLSDQAITSTSGRDEQVGNSSAAMEIEA